MQPPIVGQCLGDMYHNSVGCSPFQKGLSLGLLSMWYNLVPVLLSSLLVQPSKIATLVPPLRFVGPEAARG